MKGKQRLKPHLRMWTKRILFAIKNGKLYCSEIAKDIGGSASVICRQLEVLESEGLLTSRVFIDKRKFPMSFIRFYSLNSKSYLLLNYWKSKEKFEKQFEMIIGAKQ